MYLNCKTNYSFRYGTFFTEELVKAGVAIGATALALTNINATPDAWDFFLHCQKEGIKPVLGAEIRNGNKFLYILLAKNNQGFALINRFLSDHLQSETPFPERPGFDSNVVTVYPFEAIHWANLMINELIGIQPSEVNKLIQIPLTPVRNKLVIRQPVTF